MFKKHEIDMINGPLAPRIILFCLPVMIASILQLLFNAADVVVVGRWVGSDALAAVGSNTSLVTLFVNLFVGLSVGVNVVAARYLGAGEDKELESTVHTAIALSLVSGLFMMIFGALFAPHFLVWMSCPPTVLPLASLYLRIYFFSMPGMMIYNFGSSLLRAQGDTQRPLIFLVISGVVNVLLNLYLVIVAGIGVAGVGIATAVSQTLSGIMVLCCLCREKGLLHLNLHRLRIDRTKLRQIAAVGIPAGLQGIVFSVSNVIVQSAVNSFGDIIMAGNAAAASVEGFVYVAMNSIYQGCITFTGQNMGAGKYKRVVRVLIDCLIIVVAVGLVLGLGAYRFGRFFLGLYSDSPVVIEAGMTRLAYICAPYFMCGIMDVFAGAIRGMGHSTAPAVVSTIGIVGFRIVWILFVFPHFATPPCLYISYVISWAVIITVHFGCWLYFRSLWYKPQKQL